MFSRIRTFPFWFELCLHLMNFHCFPPFWHRVRIVSKCDKLVTITLFGIYLVNKTINMMNRNEYALELWISTELTPKNRFYKVKMKWNVWVYSISLWICLPWDFCASSWDCEIVLKTVRLERSALGWGEGCSMLWQIYAWYCIVMKILYKSIRIKNKKYNEKLNKAMHKFEYWTSMGGGGGDMYVPCLNFTNRHFPF